MLKGPLRSSRRAIHIQKVHLSRKERKGMTGNSTDMSKLFQCGSHWVWEIAKRTALSLGMRTMKRRQAKMRLRLRWGVVMIVAAMVSAGFAADNELTPGEKKSGWVLLFNGSSLAGWMTSSEQPSQRPVEEGSINPHKCGGYMMINEKQWSD